MQVFTTEAIVDASGVLSPCFKIGSTYTSGYLKYLGTLSGKKVKITIEVLDTNTDNKKG